MDELLGFQIVVDETIVAGAQRASLQVHQDRGEEHYYGGAFIHGVKPHAGYGARHQVIYALLDIVDQVMALGDDGFDAMMKPVARPF